MNTAPPLAILTIVAMCLGGCMNEAWFHDPGGRRVRDYHPGSPPLAQRGGTVLSQAQPRRVEGPRVQGINIGTRRL